ncbi:hypothetical protein J3458_003194 [Metarhizium acridum]|uniref:uncharacterized protein n=1 Tax=Metarhizium acridum TaxID=92637 RepID=UPI001C6C65D1|nr:hypothetical protein J3458_003194 [Metarhizium acridum]
MEGITKNGYRVRRHEILPSGFIFSSSFFFIPCSTLASGVPRQVWFPTQVAALVDKVPVQEDVKSQLDMVPLEEASKMAWGREDVVGASSRRTHGHRDVFGGFGKDFLLLARTQQSLGPGTPYSLYDSLCVVNDPDGF